MGCALTYYVTLALNIAKHQKASVMAPKSGRIPMGDWDHDMANILSTVAEYVIDCLLKDRNTRI
jgi:hypothetical protein